MFWFKILIYFFCFTLFSYSKTRIIFNNRAIAEIKPLKSLEIPQKDPLLPSSNLERDLSSFEIKRIKEEIINLDKQAKQKLQEGQAREAFELWFRQLRLYRAIGLTPEIIALGNIGEIAWQNNRRNELKVINRRLDDIYLEQQKNRFADVEIIDWLAIALQKNRNFNKAISVYKILLEKAKIEGNPSLEKKYLVSLGDLYLSKFDYTQAATIYENLVFGDRYNITPENYEIYLLKLIDIYGYTKQPKQSVIVKQKLIDRYRAARKNALIGKIKLSLAKDYRALEEYALAITNYQEAVYIGKSLQQLALASEALENLGSLYQQQEQYSLAIETYQEWLELELEADNSYGVMNGYKQIGQLYLTLEEYQKAAIAFNRGLEIARLLDYQVGEFTSLIDKVKTKL